MTIDFSMHVLEGRVWILKSFLFDVCGMAHLCALIWIYLLTEQIQESCFSVSRWRVGIWFVLLLSICSFCFCIFCFSQMDEEPFNPDYVEVDRVLEVSYCEDKDTGEVE